jgi:hypothetical protein
VLVGDAAAFVDQLKAIGLSDVERIPLSQLDVNSPTLRRGAPSGSAVGRSPIPPAPRAPAGS